MRKIPLFGIESFQRDITLLRSKNFKTCKYDFDFFKSNIASHEKKKQSVRIRNIVRFVKCSFVMVVKLTSRNYGLSPK